MFIVELYKSFFGGLSAVVIPGVVIKIAIILGGGFIFGFCATAMAISMMNPELPAGLNEGNSIVFGIAAGIAFITILVAVSLLFGD